MVRRLLIPSLAVAWMLASGPAAAASPISSAPGPRTTTVAATLSGTSTVEFPGGYEITHEVMTGTIVDARHGPGTYRIDAAMVERELGFGVQGSFVMRFRGATTLSGTLLVPEASGVGDLDGTLVVEAGTGRFRNMTGGLAFHLGRSVSGSFDPPNPVSTTDAGSASGTLVGAPRP